MIENSKDEVNILETNLYTVTSGGHWFNATSQTVDEFVPGLLEKHSFDKLISKAVLWIDSTDSIALLLYFLLVFTTDAIVAAVVTLLFHIWWYFNKSAFVNLLFMPVINILNKDFTQLLIAAVALSFLGINENYLGLLIGVIYLFLFKVGLLRLLLNKMQQGKVKNRLPLNDRVFKMVLIKYAIYEDIAPPEVEKIDKHVQNAIIKNRMSRKK